MSFPTEVGGNVAKNVQTKTFQIGERMIEEVPLKNLTLLEQNPRKITKDQMSKLCKSIQEDPDFLFKRPVLVNLTEGKNIVYAGNQRVRAAKQLKMEAIPCIVDKDIPEDLMKMRVLKDNKTFGEFDFDMLANEWDIEALLNCGFEPKDLLGVGNDIDDLGTQDEPKKKKGKKITCPNCGFESGNE